MYVIAWDFALVFAGDPEFLPLYELGWRTQPVPRLHFGSTTSIRFSRLQASSAPACAVGRLGRA